MEMLRAVGRGGFRAAACALLLLVAACASGPKFDEVQTGFPAVSDGQGRIYVYRSGSMLGAALQPAVKLDGVKVGESVPGGFFYVDKPPGTYTVTTTTEKEEAVTVTLSAGDTKYVRMDVGMGLFVGHVIPSIIDAQQAKEEIRNTHYTPYPPPAH